MIFRPRLRKANWRRRVASVSKLNSLASMIVVSGLNVILVPVLLDLPVLASGALRNAFLVILFPGGFVAPNFQMEGFRKRVDATDANAMQTAGDFVSIRIKLAAGVEFGQHNLSGRNAFFGMHINRNATAVIDDGDGVIDVDGDTDFGAIARQRFVDGIVDDFVDEVVQAHFARGADVHGRAQTHCFQAFEHFNTS